jgi:hypothetical protein
MRNELVIHNNERVTKTINNKEIIDMNKFTTTRKKKKT